MSTSDDQLSSAPTAMPHIVASGSSPQSDTTSNWEDVQQALSLPTWLPLAVQPLLITLQHLLLTNDPPPSQHSVIVSECLCILDDLIAKSDATLPPTFTPYDAIPAKHTTSLHAHLKCLRKRVQSIDSGFRRLPQEIWQEIFLFMRPSDEDGKVNVFNLRDPLYIVSQVCRTWRTASHRHARLWSQIVIKTSKVRLQAPRDGVLRLQKVLERARSAPLDFTFYSNSETTRLSIALLSLLTEYSQQWRSVAVRWLTPKEARPLELVCGRVPELQTVTLSFTRGGKDVKPTDLISAFQFAPKLSQVALHDFPLGQVSLDSSVKQNLQSLNLTYPCGEEDMANGFSLSKFLCEYPSLKKFYLFRCRESTARAWPTPCGGASRTIYAGLTSVCAVEGGSLNRISLPSLVHLEVGSYTETLNPGVVPCVISLLQHSRCRLATLDLCAAAWDEESLRVLLALVPDLNALTITFESMQGVDDAVRILTHCLSDGSPEPKYVPRLKVLYIDLAFMGMKWSFVDERFLDMVFIRADWGLLVVDFFVEYWGIDSVPVLTEDDLRRWDDLKKAGLIHVDPPHY